ncbi:MAG: hypothetical protein HY699_18580 [Deltaproteobacteria bacterium]|nr:hypothetical protein [Deltaproteobacteria bacterium]
MSCSLRKSSRGAATQDYIGDFFDLNGDGLPDVIDSSNWSPTNRKWQVYLKQRLRARTASDRGEKRNAADSAPTPLALGSAFFSAPTRTAALP